MRVTVADRPCSTGRLLLRPPGPP